MSTIKSSAENLTLNADGSGNDIIFQSNASNVATLDQAGLLTATTFAGSGASLTALPAANLTGSLPAISGASLTGITTGKVLQVVSVNLPTAVTVTYSASWQDLAGMSVAITPSATTSKIYIMCSLTSANSNHSNGRILRDSTAVGAGTAAGSRPGGFSYGNNPGGGNSTRVDSMNFLDSPSTTSATTYKVQLFAANGSGNIVYINRTPNDTDAVYGGRGSSTLTLMEIGA